MFDPMTFSQEQIREAEELNLEISINESKIKKYEALEKLMNDENFKLVIIDGFIKNKSEEIFKELIKPFDMRTISKAECDSTLDCISMLIKYVGGENTKSDLYYEAIRAKELLEELRKK